MRIRHLYIENFRGIKTLNWTVLGTTICLIGPNNATKTTILQAIEAVLSPKWNLTFNDTDFYDCDIDQKITICATISELPQKLLSLDKYGEYLRGWDSENNIIIDEPTGNNEVVLSIRLTIDNTLEPNWEVYSERNAKQVNANDRRELGVAYVTAYVDRDFSWGKGTPLSRATDDQKHLNLPEINRQAKQAIEQGTAIQGLNDTSKNIQVLSKPYGVKPKHEFKPSFDLDAMSITNGTLAIHDGPIPIRQYGLGSKRLISLAIQKEMTKNGAIVLIDEIEHGLEPYRLRQLIRLLRPPSTNPTNDNHSAQVIMTTHSAVTVVELHAKELCVIRSEDGTTSVTPIPSDLQSLVRSVPEALLSPRIIVCEGKTEVGLLRAMDHLWATHNNDESMAYHGVSVADGQGNTNAPGKALELKKLGYEVILFVDSDKPCNPTVDQVRANDIKVIVWDDETNTEGRIFLDLPPEIILAIIGTVQERLGAEETMNQLGSKLQESGLTIEKISDLLNNPEEEDRVRFGIGKVASSKNSWFKRTDLAEEIGDLIGEGLNTISGSDLAVKLEEIRAWIYGQ